MATRMQRFWQSPYADLAAYRKPDGTPLVEMGTLPVEYNAWYAERKTRGELSQMVDRACYSIERIEGLYSSVLRKSKL